MNEQDIVERICRLPIDFQQGNKSQNQLVQESGILDLPTQMARQSIQAYLRDHPDLVAVWLDWSADKRCSPSWCFLKEGALYSVSYFPDGERLLFDDGIEACAEFILRDVGIPKPWWRFW